MKSLIYYKKIRKYKYKTHHVYIHETGIIPNKPGNTKFLKIDINGRLTIKIGYAWDGASGPARDTKNFMRGSLVHDALYQLIREGILTPKDRKPADKLLRVMCIEDGMSRFRAAYIYRVVRFAGKSSTKPDLLTAP